MKEVRCHHCGHEWTYKGKSPYYATCPSCHYKVRVDILEEVYLRERS